MVPAFLWAKRRRRKDLRVASESLPIPDIKCLILRNHTHLINRWEKQRELVPGITSLSL